MRCSYFSARINVEKTYEQCYLGYHNSQKMEEVSDGISTQVRVQIINKCKATMASRRLYKKGSPHKEREGKKEGEQRNSTNNHSL